MMATYKIRIFFLALLALTSASGYQGLPTQCDAPFQLMLEVAGVTSTELRYGHHEFVPCDYYPSELYPYACTNDHKFYLKRVRTAVAAGATDETYSLPYQDDSMGNWRYAGSGVHELNSNSISETETNLFSALECCLLSNTYSGTNHSTMWRNDPRDGWHKIVGPLSDAPFTEDTYFQTIHQTVDVDGTVHETTESTNTWVYTSYPGVTNSPYIAHDTLTWSRTLSFALYTVNGTWVTNSNTLRRKSLSGDDDENVETLGEQYTTDMMIEKIYPIGNVLLPFAEYIPKTHAVAFLQSDDPYEHSITGAAFIETCIIR